MGMWVEIMEISSEHSSEVVIIIIAAANNNDKAGGVCKRIAFELGGVSAYRYGGPFGAYFCVCRGAPDGRWPRARDVCDPLATRVRPLPSSPDGTAPPREAGNIWAPCEACHDRRQGETVRGWGSRQHAAAAAAALRQNVPHEELQLRTEASHQGVSYARWPPSPDPDGHLRR
ncbi:hypothetical protein BHE74_00024521 [Ensete ventricosum]|nr:hypothetical protein GW17_00005988 [Ensete ventricosum]RWW67989.1 hypothetical protein BHE74_00024521 [Ensete ventricosum]RZS04748.1 hypothetical protein BHM03_00035124 [Ensete ventricosum]